MAPALHELGIDRMSVEQRIALAQEIWDSIAEETLALQPDAKELAELARRAASDQQYPGEAVDWDRIRKDAADRWRR